MPSMHITSKHEHLKLKGAKWIAQEWNHCKIIYNVDILNLYTYREQLKSY